MPHRKLNDMMVRKLQPRSGAYLVWDTMQRGFAVQVQPTGNKAYKVIYRHGGRPRWFTVGAVGSVGLADARKLAGRVIFQVAEGKDPAAERRAERNRGTFEELATRYLEEHAKRKNRSWRQADKLIRANVLPRWSKITAAEITRRDVKVMVTRIRAPITANQTLAAISAIFSWAVREDIVKVNPCQLVERNRTTDRDRVLSATEIPRFWAAFDDAGLHLGTALKMILLTGQRPGEVAHMRREHLVDGWWEMPGTPVPSLRWPGTKNGQSHRVWLPKPALALLAELDEDAPTGGAVFARVTKLAGSMQIICKKLKAERATPHDLRRTHGTMITSLQFGRDAMNRIQNHRDGGIASVYDRHGYAEEDKRIMEAVAARVMALVGGDSADNVVAGKFGHRVRTK